ncbi:replication endonuclease [Cellvibrio sp. UBA7661]|uniref:replication endonuclease n=1 Tax=Cellvibrio sp. UBA7661 TaxID=1946311 RepID=UPI002F354927
MPLYTDEALSLTEGYGTHECRLFRAKIFDAHPFLCMTLAKDYVRTAKAKGYVTANHNLRRYNERLVLGARFQGIYIDSPDEDVKRFAEQRSLNMTGLSARYIKQYGLRKAARLVQVRLASYGFDLPLNDIKKANEDELAGAIARVSDSAWWRREIRNLQERTLESLFIELGLVNRIAGIYASNICVARKWQQWQRNEALLASLEAENDLGQVFNLLDLAKRGISNLVNRRNEMMTRISGLEGYAKDQAHVAVFYTMTAPSKYHAYHSKPCKPNPKYNNATPADTQDYFNKIWARIRASFKHSEIQPYGIRVVEPHHDGTPHWHMLFFMPPNQVEQTTQIIKRYALAEDGDEAGAELRRLKVELIDPAKGSAIGYVAKYIAKNIDGEHVGADLYGHDAIDSAIRIRAWASIWNIRQFQFIGSPSVTVWREARRFATSEAAQETLERIGSDQLTAIVEACDKGDFKTFVELSGGATVPLKDQPLRALHVAKETPNKYGEAIKKLIGLCFKGIETIKTHIREWIVRPVDLSTKKNDFGMGFALGGANAPPLEFCQ